MKVKSLSTEDLKAIGGARGGGYNLGTGTCPNGHGSFVYTTTNGFCPQCGATLIRT